jgi:hypothetical protein
MGLLDDAIREHLDLKRRRGADPDEVAREQREALTAAAERQRAGGGEDGADPVPSPPDGAAIDSHESDGEAHPSAGHTGEDFSPAQTSHPAIADETAELDMRSVLGDDADAQDPSTPPAEGVGEPGQASARPVPARPATEEDASDEDSLEWEVPGEGSEEETEQPAEDVLEETPDFLRDTPEQDRLWFEQQPPRDFDFDK